MTDRDSRAARFANSRGSLKESLERQSPRRSSSLSPTRTRAVRISGKVIGGAKQPADVAEATEESKQDNMPAEDEAEGSTGDTVNRLVALAIEASAVQFESKFRRSP